MSPVCLCVYLPVLTNFRATLCKEVVPQNLPGEGVAASHLTLTLHVALRARRLERRLR